MIGPLIWIFRRESPSHHIYVESSPPSCRTYGLQINSLCSTTRQRLSSPKTDFEQTKKKNERVLRRYDDIPVSGTGHLISSQRSSQEDTLWRSPLLVYPGHSAPGQTACINRPFLYCSKNPNFQSVKTFLRKGVLFARKGNRKSWYFHFEGLAIALVSKRRLGVTQKWPKSSRRPLCRRVIPSIFVSVSVISVNSITYVLSLYT